MQNTDFLKIIVTESLKKNNKEIPIFEVVTTLLTFESQKEMAENLLDYEKSHIRWVSEFFTNIVPCVFLHVI